MADEPKPTALVLHQTKELVAMLNEEDLIGRWSSGWDADTDFDALPTKLADVTDADVQSAELFQGAEREAVEFSEPVEHFPTFKRALRKFQDDAPKTRAVRIDTDASYEGFGIEKAAKELERRINELRAHVEAHEADHHGATTQPMGKWDEVLGAVAAIKDLQSSKSAGEALTKVPQVPIALPEYAQGSVRCVQDGEFVIVSIRFAMPDGSPRIATVGAKPQVDVEGIARWAEDAGYDPVTILGVVPAVASTVTGKRLVRDAANAALDAQARAEVQEMSVDDEEPVIMIGLGENTAPLAALMYLQQRAEAGDAQAARELGIMRVAAQTPHGKRVAAPVLAEASRRLALGRARRASGADHYARLSAFV